MFTQLPWSWYRSFGKRTLDLALSIPALILFSPILAIISLMVYLTSPGGVIFRQKRLGKMGACFHLYKFRTMYNGAPDLRNADGSTFNAENDPRVTAVGRFLRKTSLDELPQLVNVLKSEMSLVGPRPDKPDQLAFYTAEEMGRLSVKPGITGLAQISGRNNIPWEQRKRIDLEYVESESLKLDLVILIRTIPYVLLRRDVFVTPIRTGIHDKT